ncbi:MAG: hypothetical protein D6690_11190 [Nitrospirae bacterium]|nr:MAG: hypothetical protein D6690_11190 [Nitrospirota bacterium]
MPESAVSERAVYRARPTLRIDEREEEQAQELLIGMTMTEREDGLSAMELRFSNVASRPDGSADLAFESLGPLQLGTFLSVYAGDEASPQEIFRGQITGLEGDFPENAPPELVVLAEDLLQHARMTRRTKIYEDLTIADLVDTIGRQLHLTPVVTGMTDTIGTWVQLNESDLAFLRRILARYDGDVQVVGTELHVSPRGAVRRGQIELELHSQLRSARVLADLAHQVTAVTVTGWNALQGQRVIGRSQGAELGPGSGITGAQMMQRVSIERSEHLGHLAVATHREATALAHAAFDERARRFVRISGTAEGNPAVRVGTHVAVQGLGPRFDNTYYVVRAVHRYDVVRGYETVFEGECAYWGAS